MAAHSSTKRLLGLGAPFRVALQAKALGEFDLRRERAQVAPHPHPRPPGPRAREGLVLHCPVLHCPTLGGPLVWARWRRCGAVSIAPVWVQGKQPGPRVVLDDNLSAPTIAAATIAAALAATREAHFTDSAKQRPPPRHDLGHGRAHHNAELRQFVRAHPARRARGRFHGACSCAAAAVELAVTGTLLSRAAVTAAAAAALALAGLSGG
mmetsp:Transcript_12813/g.30174  ORF Transcript_12813/g.30174 Transcript_12813/m.30174 type:complete len:209 (-) Transcript_12813:338-964(-)